MTLQIFQIEGDPNTRENSEQAFKVGGPGEQNGGRKQTELLARCLHRYVKLPLHGKISVLDVGCPLGDAIPVWRLHYPEATLMGCDISREAVDRCTEQFGEIAYFFRAGFDEIKGFWDVIYCSNVLEHFVQHLDIASELLRHCRYLYVVTPFEELREGGSLKYIPGEYHVKTFYTDSFSVLGNNGVANISSLTVDCPGAWSPSGLSLVKARLLRCLFGKSILCKSSIP